MESKVPPGYNDLYTASTRPNSLANLIGIVTDVLPATQSKGTDWMFTFSIADSTLGGDDDGLKIRFFKPTRAEMPAITGTGDVIVLRSIGIKTWSGMTLGLASRSTSWTLFPAAHLPDKAPSGNINLTHVKGPQAPTPKPSEILYAISLYNSRDKSLNKPLEQPLSHSQSTTVNGARSVISQPRDKFALIKDVEVDRFYNLVGQVVKLYPANGCTELYITDYTSNNLLYNYEWGRAGEDASKLASLVSSKGWRGPYGHNTLTVTLWPPQSQSNAKEDDYVYLRNVRIKFSKDAKMEGVMYTDRHYPDRIDVCVLEDLNDDRGKDLLKRKRDYWKRFDEQRKDFVAETRGQKRKAAGDQEKPLNKNQRRKLREKEHKKEQELERAKKKTKADYGTECPLPVTRTTKLDLNTNVKSTHDTIPPRRLLSILTPTPTTHGYTPPHPSPPVLLPFHNILTRATVRVVDYFPPNLSDFAVSRLTSEMDVLSDNSSSSSSSSSFPPSSPPHPSTHSTLIWEWRFCLLVEDAHPPPPSTNPPARMKLYIAEPDAQFLLNMDACDLRADARALAELREKLFILWGDLEEQKTQQRAIVRSGRQALAERDGNVSSSPARERGDREKEGEGRENGGGGIALDGSSEGKGDRVVPRGKSFTCCIKEFGVKVRLRGQDMGNRGCSDSGEEVEEGEEQGSAERERGWKWERRFRMFGTTIL